MDLITELYKQDIPSLIFGIFIIISAIITVYEIIGKFSKIIGKPVKWIKNKSDDHELLIQTAQNLSSLQEKHKEDIERSDRRDEEIAADIKKLIESFRELQISSMRREILSISDNVINGKKIGKETFLHCLKTYDKYEKIIKANNLTNSEVDFSIDLIRQSYKDFLNGEKDRHK